ncbi:MAG: phosphate acetyltransferase [Verrucomicrobia bacterium]|nr:phosphate acetyltransferase [Verrucomicrobiota bacterium]
MKHAFFLAPAGANVGLTTVGLGLVTALDRRGVRVAFFKPIGQQTDNEPERSTYFIRALTSLKPSDPIPLSIATTMVAEGKLDLLLGKVIGAFQESTRTADLVVIEGLLPGLDDPYLAILNQELLKTLNAQLVLVASAAKLTIPELDAHLEYGAKLFGGMSNVLGVILNRYQASHKQDQRGWITLEGGRKEHHESGLSKQDGDLAAAAQKLRAESRIFNEFKIALIGVVPQTESLTRCRTVDVQRHLKAEILHTGEILSRRVNQLHILARMVPNLLHTFVPGALLITPADRTDIVVAISMVALNQVRLAGLILTGDVELDSRIMDFCWPAFETGLPVLRIETNTYSTANQLYQLSSAVPLDDLERIEGAIEIVAEHLDVEWLIAQAKQELAFRLSPAAFLYQLTEKARSGKKRIVLPEGSEPRTVKAATICAAREIAHCVLLGSSREIESVAKSQGLELPKNLEILDPPAIREKYAAPLYEARKHKGLSMEMAASQLEDNVVLGTMMLALGEVDGLVSGAIHSTANTIRPALQIIKTKPNIKAVSSIFFMCLPEQVLVYGDCAVIPDPEAETLADIAIQSAESARAFGIPPKVAMISYSTGKSGSGVEVEKVREATRLAKLKCPDLLVDGPLQYDAAFMPDVAKSKAPDSPVAGQATVFIFPDLNTGNTTYKAVQRSANVLSIGPMLQGLRRPVNDLSRGALVDDIVYTIALTAVQAMQEQ